MQKKEAGRSSQTPIYYPKMTSKPTVHIMGITKLFDGAL